MFFITCFTKVETDKLGWLDMGSSRTFGFLPDFESAKTALNENHCDMFEYLYSYAIVEEMNAGIHPSVENRWFFKWDSEKSGFFEIEEPKAFKGFCNIALG